MCRNNIATLERHRWVLPKRNISIHLHVSDILIFFVTKERNKKTLISVGKVFLFRITKWCFF